MKTFNYVVTDAQGIHARPAGMLVKAVKDFASEITIEKDGKAASAKKLMAIMSLGIKAGQEITVKVEGADEETAAAALETFFKENL